MKSIRIIAALAALAIPAVLAAPATALTFDAGVGISAAEGFGPTEDNTITFSRNADGTISVTDTSVNPTPGVGCVATAAPNTISCTVTDSSINLQSLAGTDVVTNTAVVTSIFVISNNTKLTFTCGAATNCSVNGGAGDDVLIGGTGSNQLNGGAGNDQLTGGPSFDSLSGGSGNDTMDGGAGGDNFTCDAGSDTIKGGTQSGSALGGFGFAPVIAVGAVLGAGDAYNCSTGTAGISVTLDGVANDGAPGELDNIGADIEVVTGTRFDDTFIGTAGAQVFAGSDGNDQLYGGAGNDGLFAGDGNDTVLGEAGSDTVDGGLGADSVSGGTGEDSTGYTDRENGVRVSLDNKANDGESGEGDNMRPDVENITGGAGDDTFVGNALPNEFIGGPGDDSLSGAAGSDELNGGAGDDKLSGGTGNDELIGGSGSDQLFTVDKKRDIANCGSGFDRVIGERGFDSIWATCEAFGPVRKTKKTNLFPR